MEVEASRNVAQENGLLAEADAAVDRGDHPRAIALYARVLRRNPDDTEVRRNLVALWLGEAAREDKAGNTGTALAAYANALRNWRGNAQMGEAIRARMDFLEAEFRPFAE